MSLKQLPNRKSLYEVHLLQNIDVTSGTTIHKLINNFGLASLKIEG
jgi:hypothetical protein